MKENQVPGSNQGKKASGSAPWKKIKYLEVPKKKDKYLEVFHEKYQVPESTPWKKNQVLESIPWKKTKYLEVLH